MLCRVRHPSRPGPTFILHKAVHIVLVFMARDVFFVFMLRCYFTMVLACEMIVRKFCELVSALVSLITAPLLEPRD